MSVRIPAEAKCDQYDCGATQACYFEYRADERGLPVLSLELPEGWAVRSDVDYDNREGRTKHYCPEHAGRR